MNDLVSYVCVRADHQWASLDAGRAHRFDDQLGWCPDASLDAGDGHDWRACELSPLASVASQAAYLVALESAVS